MATATFDTLKFANTLKAAGVPDKQAEAQAAVFGDALQVNFKELATKEDLARLVSDIERLVADVKREIKEESTKTHAKFDTIIAKLQGDNLLLKWMFGASMTVGLGILIRLFLLKSPI